MLYRVRPMELINQEEPGRPLPINKENLNERPNIFLHQQFTPIGETPPLPGRLSLLNNQLGSGAHQAGSGVFEDISSTLKKGLKSAGKFIEKEVKVVGKAITEKPLSSALKIGSALATALGQPEFAIPLSISATAASLGGLGQSGRGARFSVDVLSPNADQESQIVLHPLSYSSASLADALTQPIVKLGVPQQA